MIVCGLVFCALSACASSGGYFEDDGPPMFSGFTDYANAPNAAVRLEKPAKGANKPYTVNGKRYYPMTGDAPLTQTGMASWYGKKFHGKKTSTGETYDMYAMTAAHPTMELPSYARVTNLASGKSIIVRVNDRGPFLNNRIIDLSYAAASKLGYVKNGTALVRVERITRAQIASGRVPGTARLGEVRTVAVQQDLRADALAIESVIAGLRASQPRVSSEHFEAQATDQQAEKMISIEDAINFSKPFEQDTAPSTVEVASEPAPQAQVDIAQIVREEKSAQTSSDTVEIGPAEATALYYRQAGVFSTKENARRVAAELLGEVDEPIEIYEDGGRFRVLVGRGETREKVLERIKAAGPDAVRFVPFGK